MTVQSISKVALFSLLLFSLPKAFALNFKELEVGKEYQVAGAITITSNCLDFETVITSPSYNGRLPDKPQVVTQGVILSSKQVTENTLYTEYTLKFKVPTAPEACEYTSTRKEVLSRKPPEIAELYPWDF